MFDLHGLFADAEVGSSSNLIEGAFCKSSGLRVFPRSAVALDGQVMLSVSVGRKSSMTTAGDC